MDTIEQRVTRIETKMDFLATKEDIANIRSDLHKEIVSSTRWSIATMLVVAGVALAAAKLIGI